jgi:2-oxo-4-hydroxy-4-carboxy--5-ureidoimidazoline (OHCU) decarboxylase
MSVERFVESFGGIFEHSPWIAERAWNLELGPAHDTAIGLAQCAVPGLSIGIRPMSVWPS